MEKNQNTRINVRGRLSFVHLFKPHAATPGAEEKYSTTILVPKSDTAAKQKIDAAISFSKATMSLVLNLLMYRLLFGTVTE